MRPGLHLPKNYQQIRQKKQGFEMGKPSSLSFSAEKSLQGAPQENLLEKANEKSSCKIKPSTFWHQDRAGARSSLLDPVFLEKRYQQTSYLPMSLLG